MAGIYDPAGAQRVLELAIGPDAPAGTTLSNVVGVSVSHPDLAWDFALQHADQLHPLLDSQAFLLMMPAIASSSSDPKRIADLQAYADKNLPAGARQYVEKAIVAMNQNAKFRAERLPEIDAWLTNKAAH